MRDAQVFNIPLVISSQSDEFLGFRECVVLFISASVIGIIFIAGEISRK
jgi:hypothetical protein